MNRRSERVSFVVFFLVIVGCLVFSQTAIASDSSEPATFTMGTFAPLVSPGPVGFSAPPKPTKQQFSSLTSNPIITIFNNWNFGGVQNGPSQPTVFTISDPMTITHIRNYHWNFHNGTELGAISLRHSDGTLYGPWAAIDDVPYDPTWNPHHCVWGVYPDVLIKPGQYTVIDSEPQTWSYNNSSGFSLVEGYVSALEVISVTSTPGTLWLDKTGNGSGIVFKAMTSGPTTVTFKVRTPSGQEFVIGSEATSPSGNDNVAKRSYWGDPSFVSGTYTIIAEAGGTSEESTFTVNRIKASALGNGTWMNDSKDPIQAVSPEPKAETCPLQTWDSATGNKDGYFQGLSVGDPVNLVSGNYNHAQIDLSLKSRNALTLARIYNSLDVEVGPFGRGWSCPYLSHLVIHDTTVTFVNSDGSRMLFTKQGDSYVGPTDIDLSLSFSTDTNLWAIRRPDGMEWSFDTAGKIIRIANSCCGRGVTDAVLVEYRADGTLYRVTNPGGQWFEFTSNADGRITQVTDMTGRTLQYSYSSNGNLESFIDPIGRVTSYSYSDDDYLTNITAPGNIQTNITYAEGRVTAVTAPDGARSTFAWRLSPPGLTLTDPNGMEYVYSFDENWRLTGYSVPALNIAKQIVSSGTAVTGIENALGARETYSYQNGFLSGKIDVMGNETRYEYHPTLHRLTKITDPLGRNRQFTWCSRGNLIAETDPAGGVASYTYDGHNNRTSRVDQLGRVQRWVFDDSGNYLIRSINPEGGISSFSYDVRGNLISSSDPLGRTTLFSFDRLDRLVKTIYPDSRFTELVYNDAGRIVIRRDNLGRETHYQFDSAGRLTMLTRPDGTTFNSTFNAAGQKISETDPLGRVTRFEHSPIGLLTKTIYPDGSFETMTYDTESRLVSRTNELGQTTNLEYDAMGRLLATIDPTGARWESQFDAAGRKISDKDPLNRVTAYQLDTLDRITKVIRPDSSFTTNSFDAVGNLLSANDALGNRWAWSYDSLNRQVKAIQPNGASSTVTFDAAGQVIAETDALNRVSRNSFDLGGRKTVTTDALGNVWQNFYDGAGRLMAVKDPMGAVSSMSFDIMDRVISQSDPLGNLVTFEFDNAGRRVAKTDALGRRSITVFDLRDRVISEVDPGGHTVSYGYNLGGQRVSLTDGANRVWRWEHNSLGRVTAEIAPLSNVNRYSFDSVGNRTTWTNARNQTTRYSFNSMNRLSQVTYPDGTLATMAFDLEGRELVRSGPTGSVAKTWDSVGNLTSETFGPWGKKWQYGFDLVGNRTSAIDPEGGVYQYAFDRLNRLVKLDPPGHDNEISYVFNAAGYLINETRPGVKTSNLFDRAGRLLELRHERDQGSRKMVASRKYTYSSVGNRLTMIDEEGATTKYFYNNADWLTKGVYPDGQQVSWSYNGAGDRLIETTETPTIKGNGRNAHPATITVVLNFGYDPGGRMVSRASDTFQYDRDGNLTTAIESGDEARYAWSPDNRLLKAEKDIKCPKHGKKHCHQCPQTFTTSESYGYEPLSWKRLTRKTDDQTFVSIFDQDDESHEYLVKSGRDDKDDHGKKWPGKGENKSRLELIRQFIGGPGTDDLEITKYHGRTLEVLKDALGSTIALTNKGGKAVSRMNYDAWGNLRFPNKPGHGVKPCEEKDLDDYLDRCDGGRAFENTGFDPWHLGRHHSRALVPYLYTGRRFDAFSSLYNNRNRYYSPRVGRFTSADPIGFDGGNNLYAYANLNPVLYTDPFGLFSLQDLGLVAGNAVWKKAYARVKALVSAHIQSNAFTSAGWCSEADILKDFKYDANSKPEIVFGTGIGLNNGFTMGDTLKINANLLDKNLFEIIKNSKLTPITEDELAMFLSNTILHEISHWKAGEATFDKKIQGDEFVDTLNDGNLLKLFKLDKTNYYEIRQENSITRY